MLLLYHATSRDAAARVLNEGFLDQTGQYLTTSLHTGVWVSDRPEFYLQGAEALLEVDLQITEGAIAKYEWKNEPPMGYREFLVPASVVNQGTVRPVSDDEFWERMGRGEWDSL